MRIIRSESGTALIEFVWLAVLLLVPLVYILVAVFDVQRAAYGVSAASKASARAFLLAPDVATAHSRAQRAAKVALADQHVSGAQIAVNCLPRSSNCLTPGSSVRVTVKVSQPLPLMPDFLGQQSAAIKVDSTHAEPYSRYRQSRP